MAFTEIRPEDSLASQEPDSLLGLTSQVQVADQSLGRLQGHGHASISSVPLRSSSSLPPHAFPRLAQVWCWATLGAISMGRAAAGTEPFLSNPGRRLLLGHPSPTVPQPWHFGSYVLSKAPERVLLHKGHMVSSKALQDLLGLSPKPSGGPDWEGTPLAGSMLELEAEEKGKRSHSEGPNLKHCLGVLGPYNLQDN